MAYTAQQADIDEARFLQLAAQYEAKGDPDAAILFRVEAANCVQRIGAKKHHKPSMGPYSDLTPKRCQHCGAVDWAYGDECVPNAR
jgi:thymidylate kinase